MFWNRNKKEKKKRVDTSNASTSKNSFDYNGLLSPTSSLYIADTISNDSSGSSSCSSSSSSDSSSSSCDSSSF